MLLGCDVLLVLGRWCGRRGWCHMLVCILLMLLLIRDKSVPKLIKSLLSMPIQFCVQVKNKHLEKIRRTSKQFLEQSLITMLQRVWSRNKIIIINTFNQITSSNQHLLFLSVKKSLVIIIYYNADLPVTRLTAPY